MALGCALEMRAAGATVVSSIKYQDVDGVKSKREILVTFRLRVLIGIRWS